MGDTSRPASPPPEEAGTPLPEFLLAAAFGEDDAGGVDSVPEGLLVGAYRIVARIGRGGMGTVYEAEQRSPPRRVALKLLRPSHASRAMIGRFQREVRLLASLQHPGIAQVFEAGSVRPEGFPLPLHFFALELVRGLPLDEHARAHELDLRSRCELVARVCDAVQHAHQHGVIHRDLKPGNILVGPAADGGDAIGQPKVLDFGVALALEPEDGQASQHTLHGQILGTLGYMSPEQVAGEPGTQDTRSDVYSLGVVLYQLLTGRPPVDVQDCTVVEAARRIRSVEPARPSALERRVPADLDLVVLKALAKERGERYQSAAGLADDLRRFVRGEPVEARAHSSLYVLRKLVARNPALASAAAALAVLLVAFALVSRQQAGANRRLAARLSQELARSDLERGRLFAVAGNLSVAEDVLWGELLREPSSDEALWALRDLYLRYPNLATHLVCGDIVWQVLPLPAAAGFVSVAEDGALRRHDPSGRVLAELEPRRPRGAQSLALTRDGARLVRFSSAGALDVYDGRSLGLQRSIALRPDPDERPEGGALALASDGTALVGLADGRLVGVDLDAGEGLRAIGSVGEGLHALALAPDQRTLAGGTSEGEVVLLHSDDGAVLWRRRAHDQGVARLAFSPDGGCLYSGGVDRRILRWDTSSGELLSSWVAPNGTVRQIQPLAGGARVLSSGWFSLDAWDVPSGARQVVLPMPVDSFFELNLERRLYTSGRGLLRTWDARVLDGDPPLARVGERTVGCFLGSGRQLVCGDLDGVLRVLDAGTGETLTEIPTGGGRIRSIACAPDGRRVFTGSADGVLRSIDLVAGRVTATRRPCLPLAPGAVRVSPDGRRVAYVADRDEVVVCDARDLAPLLTLPAHGLEVTCLAFLPDGQRLATVVRERSVRVFGPDGSQQLELTSSSNLWALAAAPDGSRLAATTWDDRVIVWELRPGAPEQVLRGHGASVWDVAFHPTDPLTLASASADGSARIWDLASGRARLVLDRLGGWDATSVQFSPDGWSLLVTSAQGDVRCVELRQADACIAGNLDHQLARHAEDLALPAQQTRERVLARLAGG